MPSHPGGFLPSRRKWGKVAPALVQGPLSFILFQTHEPQTATSGACYLGLQTSLLTCFLGAMPRTPATPSWAPRELTATPLDVHAGPMIWAREGPVASHTMEAWAWLGWPTRATAPCEVLGNPPASRPDLRKPKGTGLRLWEAASFLNHLPQKPTS